MSYLKSMPVVLTPEQSDLQSNYLLGFQRFCQHFSFLLLQQPFSLPPISNAYLYIKIGIIITIYQLVYKSFVLLSQTYILEHKHLYSNEASISMDRNNIEGVVE